MTNHTKIDITYLTDPKKPIILIGDIHGEWRALFAHLDRNKISNCYLLCVGDVGMGFPNGMDGDAIIYNEYFEEMGIEFLAIRGNHDDRRFFDGSINLSNFNLLPDYSVLQYQGELWQLVGGAISVDRWGNHRVEGRSYWKNEPFDLIESKAIKCDVLVTHTAPSWIGPGLKGAFIEGCLKQDPSLVAELNEEREKLNKLFDICQPKKAFFGHFHESSFVNFKGPLYSCDGRILDIFELYEYRKSE